MKLNLACILGALAMAMMASPADAQTSTSNLGVSMNIAAGCTVASGTIAFGTWTGTPGTVDQTGSFAVTCTNTTPYNIGFDAGLNGSSVAARRMKRGANADFINYTLFRDPTRTNNWGNTVGTDTLPGTGNGNAQTISVYGRVPAQTLGAPGTYTDTITVTVTY